MQCQVVAVLFPCTLSSFLLYESLFLMTWCLIGDIRVLSAFDTCFGTLAIFPACTAFLPVPHRENSLWGRPLSRMVTSRGDFGIRELACWLT